MCELRGVTLRSGQGDCVRCYSSFNSLARHLRTQHSDPSSSVSSRSARDDNEPHAVVTESSGCNNDMWRLFLFLIDIIDLVFSDVYCW